MNSDNNENNRPLTEHSLSHIYTPLSEAKKEIWRRWNDEKLRKKVEEFLGEDKSILKEFGDAPKAVLSRYITTPNFEFFYFLDLVKLIDLNPLCLEYAEDKFVNKNFVKYNLCKLSFYNRTISKKHEKVSLLKLVNFNKFEGKKFNEIKTLNNENLINFHHTLLNSAIPKGTNLKIFDFSEWFNKTRKISKDYYYLYYLSLFICYGILFENFLMNKEEMSFNKNKVLPSFDKLFDMFGVKPLIVPIAYSEDENHPYWQYYSELIKMEIKDYGL